jgi:hypothetical protein
MNGLETVEPKRPGFLARLIGHKPRENGFVEIRNLLATRPLTTLAAADVIDVLSAYQIPREAALPELLSMYQQAVSHAVSDRVLSPEERADLKTLRYVLDLDDSGADRVEATVLQDTYRGELRKALQDKVLSDSEKQALAAMAENFALPESVRVDIYKHETLAILQDAYNLAAADRRITEEEDARLTAMAANFGINVTQDAHSQELVERFRLLARLDAGQLPSLTVPVLLQRGERCHAQYDCSLKEVQTVTKRINYSGPTARIRIAKGLSWRFGSVSLRRVTHDEMRRLDSGTLYITNKRLLFNGARANVQTPFKRIIRFTRHKDGLQIEKDAGRDQFYLGDGDLEVIAAILESALRVYQQG